MKTTTTTKQRIFPEYTEVKKFCKCGEELVSTGQGETYFTYPATSSWAHCCKNYHTTTFDEQYPRIETNWVTPDDEPIITTEYDEED